MAAVSVSKTKETHKRIPTTFVQERRRSSVESFGTLQHRFLNAPIPEPTKNEDDHYFPPKAYSPVGDKKKKKRKKKKESFDPKEEERERLRLQELKEWLETDVDKSGRHHELNIAMLKHMRVLDDLGKLKAHYYLEYMDALTDKVQEQRKDIERKSEIHKQKLMRRERKEKKEAQRLKVEMHRPSVTSDNTFLRSLPKTHFHKIVVLQDQLIRDGHLRYDKDVQAFWEEIQQPAVYHQLFGEDSMASDDAYDLGTEAKTKPTTNRDRDVDEASQGSDSLPESGSISAIEPSHFGSLAQIQEVREPSRPGSVADPYVQSWVNEPKSKKKMSQPALTKKPVHPKVLEMEAKCPRVEFPQLAAYTLDLEPPKEDPEVEEMREDFRTRARIRNAEVRRLRKMYENSMTNRAATQRIFDMKDDLMAVLSGPPLCDIVQRITRDDDGEKEIAEEKNERLALPPPPEYATSRSLSPQNKSRHSSKPLSRHTSNFMIERISEEGDIEHDADDVNDDDDEEEENRREKLLTYSSRSSSRRSSLTSTESEIRRNAPVMPEPRRPHPLTMNAVMEKSEVKVIKGPSSLWINYGKFLPSVQ